MRAGGLPAGVQLLMLAIAQAEREGRLVFTDQDNQKTPEAAVALTPTEPRETRQQRRAAERAARKRRP